MKIRKAMTMICAIDNSTMTHLADDLFICSQCSLISSRTVADKSIYDKSYVLKYQRYEKSELGQEIQKLRYETVHGVVKKGKLLDYGCGVGSFIKHCSFNGVIAKGFDINPYGEFCDPSVMLEDYDIVTFWDSLEHVEDPIKLINGLSAKYLFICSPSTDDFKGKKSDLPIWRHYMPEEHVHYFNERSLKALLTRCGYKISVVHYEESELRKGGSDKNIITIGGIRG